MDENRKAWLRRSGFAIGGALIVMGWVLAAMPEKLPPNSFQAVAVRKVMTTPWTLAQSDVAALDAAEARPPAPLRCGVWKSEIKPGSTEALAGELRTRSQLVLHQDGRYSLDVLALVNSTNYRPAKHVGEGRSEGRFSMRGAVIVFAPSRGEPGLLPQGGRVAIHSASPERLVLDVGGGAQWPFVADALQAGPCPR